MQGLKMELPCNLLRKTLHYGLYEDFLNEKEKQDARQYTAPNGILTLQRVDVEGM